MKDIEISENDIDYKKKVQRFQRIGAVCAALIMGGVFLYFYIRYGKQLYEIFGDAERLKIFLSQFKGFDKWVFVAIRAFQTVIKIIPAEPLEIGSGVLYGTWEGMFLCLLGTMIGSFVIIALTRAFGKKLVGAFIPIEKIEEMPFLKNEKKVYLSLFFIYLIPGTPKDVLTYVAGLTGLRMRKFLLITGIARIPSIITSTWCGQEILNKNYTLAIIIFAVTGILSVVCSLIYNKYSSAKEKREKEEAVSDGSQTGDGEEDDSKA